MTIKHIKELIGYLISLFSILEIVFHLESFTVATMTWLTVTNICVTNDHVIYSVCGSYNPIFSLLTTYHGVCNKCNTTGATSVAGSVHPSEAPEFTPVLYECS